MKILLFITMTISWLFSSEIYIASGAGYKRPITELAKVFEQEKNIKINPMFGNMQQISEQIKNSDKISMFFGDEDFINKLKIKYTTKVELGDGVLVLVASSGKNISKIEDLLGENIKKIGMPDTKKAIYGVAAKETLTYLKLQEKLQEKAVVLQTVPQVSSYLVSGDIDAGFINKTDYLGIKEKVGNSIEVNPKFYNPIKIVGVVLDGKNNQEIQTFLTFMESPKAKAILKNNGL